ncbi:MAG: SDR family NAD(P)-dependent oxidoreductase [Gammaproteobacteria bacterium]
MNVEGKVVAITGVTTGIGRAAMRGFARRGARVVGAARRTERGEELVAELRAEGCTASFVTADVSRPEDCRRLIEATVAEHGRIDGLVNNAGGSGGGDTYTETHLETPERFAQIVHLNLLSAFFCSTAAIPHMQRQGGGSIVNVSSVVGTQAMARQALYASSKAALNQLSRCMAVEYLDDGIRVNSLIIGGAATKAAAKAMTQAKTMFAGAGATPETMPLAVQATEMDAIVDAMLLLCSDASRAITAADIPVDRARSAGAVFSAALMDALAGRWTR